MIWFILRMIDKSFIENMHKVAKIFSFCIYIPEYSVILQPN